MKIAIFSIRSLEQYRKFYINIIPEIVDKRELK